MLTRRQKDVYDFIAAYIAEHQISPTFQEIANQLGIKNRSNVHAFLNHMEKKGYIRRSKDKLSRSVELLGRQEICGVCGKIILGGDDD